MKYLRSTTLGYKDIGIRKSEFVPKTQFLSQSFILWRIAGSLPLESYNIPFCSPVHEYYMLPSPAPALFYGLWSRVWFTKKSECTKPASISKLTLCIFLDKLVYKQTRAILSPHPSVTDKKFYTLLSFIGSKVTVITLTGV